MKIIFDYEKDPEKHRNISKEGINEAGKKIQKLENFLCEKLPRCLKFLQQDMVEDYFEIHLPIFDYGITIMMSKIRGRFLISVLDQRNSKVYGNLLLEGYDCIDVKELRKLGTWSTWNRVKVSIFKPDK